MASVRDELSTPHSALDACLNRRVLWMRTPAAAKPYRASVGASEWSISIDNFPEEPLYTLIIDGNAVGEFDDWPPTWARPS